jgi:NitT/TauT family transport system permease protein
MAPKAVIAALICYFPTVVNMVRGLDSPSPILFDLFALLNASRWQILFKLRLPASLPFLFASIRIATANCFIGALVAEWVSADRGAGYLMQIKMYQLETATVYATVLATSLTAILFFCLAGVVERSMVPWAAERAERSSV